jgi:hypothetical protein
MAAPGALVAWRVGDGTPTVRAIGVADLDARTPIARGMHLGIGSVSELFMGNLVLLLAQYGNGPANVARRRPALPAPGIRSGRPRPERAAARDPPVEPTSTRAAAPPGRFRTDLDPRRRAAESLPMRPPPAPPRRRVGSDATSTRATAPRNRFDRPRTGDASSVIGGRQMAFKDVTTGEMALVTSMSLEEHADARAADPAYEKARRQLAALLPLLVAAAPEEQSAVEAAIVADGRRVDALHDRFVSGIHGLIESLELVAEAEDAAAYARLRLHLFPHGPRTRNSHADEAAEARNVPKHLDEADHALLRAIPLPNARTLHDAVDTWLQTSRDLESVERRRLPLSIAAAARVTHLSDARNRWIRIAHALEAAVAVDGGTHPFLTAIRACEERAARRAHGGAPAPEKPAVPA